MATATDPYAPPTATVSDPAVTAVVPPIWNPTAAASWSLLFSPAFGACIQMLNWEALGEPQRAASAKAWFLVSLVTLAAYLAIALIFMDSKRGDAASRTLAVVFLLMWYFAAGRVQAKYVKERFGNAYPRRAWGKPLLFAFLALVAYVLIGAVVGIVFAVVQGG